MELNLINQIPKEVRVAGIAALLGALASFYIPKLLTADNVALEFAPFYKEKFINIPNLLDGRVEILVDGKPQSNLSVTDVHLFNRSHKDLKEIPVTFEFYKEDNSQLPEVLGKQLSKPDTFPKDSITEVPQQDNQFVRYKISSLPIADDYDTDFIASFVFLGDSSPKVRVQSDYTDGKVISIYKYDKARRERNQLIQFFSILALCFLALIAWAIWDTRRSTDKFLKKLGLAAETLEYTGIDKEKLREVAIESYQIATKKINKSKHS
jgi:hypothetical protein